MEAHVRKPRSTFIVGIAFATVLIVGVASLAFISVECPECHGQGMHFYWEGKHVTETEYWKADDEPSANTSLHLKLDPRPRTPRDTGNFTCGSCSVRPRYSLVHHHLGRVSLWRYLTMRPDPPPPTLDPE